MNEGKFSGKSAVYAAYRPGYPDALFAALFADAGFRPGMAVADVGAGTGIFGAGLVARGCRVFAVEPNDDMRAEAEARWTDRSTFTPVAGTAEATALPNGGVDAVVAAQAFHWFDRDRFRAECRRILSGDGPVALVWNHRDEDDPAVNAVREVNRTHCPAFNGFSGGMRAAGEGAFAAFFRDGQYTRRAFPFVIEHTEDAFVGRALSSSYAPRPGDAGHAPYAAALRGVFGRFADGPRLRTPMVCQAYWGAV